ncbi:ROK family protein [Patescibacteria group bacterium]|nr:MAG: ROK family protein [Patescibacteria group bacterium]
MFVLFDVGGTSTRVAVSKNGKKIDRIRSQATPQKFAEGVSLIARLAAELSQGQRIGAVVGGVPGPLDARKSKIIKASNLPDWTNKPFRQKLEQILKAPVTLENDADLAGLGEAVLGAGRGKRIVAYITISTGIGGTRLVDGKLDVYSVGFEPGHQLITFKGQPTDFESCASGTAMAKRYGRPAHTITSAKAWTEEARLVAQGLANTIVHWSPDIMVLGGGVGRRDLPIEQVNAQLKKMVTIFPKVPKAVRTKLGDQAGLLGALVISQGLKRG